MTATRSSAVRLTEEQKALASDPRAIGVADAIATRFMRLDGLDWDDVKQCARLAMVKLALKYTGANGASFTTFLFEALPWKIVHEMRLARMIFRAGSRRQLHVTEELKEEEDLHSGDLDVGWEVESEDAVTTFINNIHNPKAKHVVALLFLNAATPDTLAVAKHLGVTRRRVQRILKELADEHRTD